MIRLGQFLSGYIIFDMLLLQYSVTLQSEEEVHPDHKRSVKQAPSVISYNKQHEMCLSWKYLQLILPIPFHITPAFSTNLGKFNNVVLEQ